MHTLDVYWPSLAVSNVITSLKHVETFCCLYYSSEPETAPLPGEWDNACNELQRMLIVRSLRPDRVAFCATSFIVNNLGSKFTEPPVLDMHQVSLHVPIAQKDRKFC